MNPTVIDFINTSRDRYLRGADPVHRDPERQRAARARGRHAPLRRVDGRAPARASASQNVRVIDTPGHPVVYGDWLNAPGAPTVLFYGHYDVQPVDPLELWISPPFEATVRDNELFARGATDDKGQLFMHLKALEAHLRQTGSLPDQRASRSSRARRRSAARTSTPSSATTRTNSPATSSSSPTRRCSTRACRRSATACAASSYFQIDLRGTACDLHSGSFGGAVANPAFVLAQMLSQMKDRGGHVKIPGFYDDVRRADASGSARSSSGCRSTRSSTARASARRSCTARPATRRSSACGRGRRSR